MGLLDYGTGANAFVQSFLKGRDSRRGQAKDAEAQEIARRRLAMEEEYKAAMIKNMMWQQQQAQAQAAQQAEDRQLAQTKAAAYQSDLMNAPVAANMPGLMQSGAVGGGSSDPRALQQVAGGTMPGQGMPTPEQIALISMRHGDPKAYLELASREKKEPPIVAALRQAAANGTISDQGLAILNKIEGGESPLYQRKPDTTETWGEPEEMNIGGKRAMVQKSSRGQVRPVISDVSTTVKVDTGNRFKDAVTLRKEFNNLPEIKEYNTMQSKFASMEKAMAESRRSNNLVAVDQALISLYNKLTDPSSVVRESEYARTAENIPLLNQIKGKADKVMRGGAGLTNAEREALMRMARLMKQGYEDIRRRRVVEYHSYATDYGIDPKTVIRDVGESGGSTPKRMTYNPATGRIE